MGTMRPRHDTTRGPFDGLTDSWLLALESEGKSPRTLESYLLGAQQLAAWLTTNGHADDVRTLTPTQVRGWLADLAATRSPETCRTRYVAVRQFIGWCIAEGETETNAMANVSQPRTVPKRVEVLRPEQLKALLADCGGSGFADLRDHALILLFADTGCRLSGVVGLSEGDVDLRERTALVRLKGGRELVLPFGATTARALDKYLRAKRRQPYGERDWLWLSSTAKGRLTGNGVQQMLRRRGTRLGLHLHPHMFRHGFADAWLRAGGGETDLMEITGWRSRQMVGRYAAASRQDRARQAHRKLSPMDGL